MEDRNGFSHSRGVEVRAATKPSRGSKTCAALTPRPRRRSRAAVDVGHPYAGRVGGEERVGERGWEGLAGRRRLDGQRQHGDVGVQQVGHQAVSE